MTEPPEFPAAPPPAYGEPPPPPRGTDPFAIGALVTSVLGMVFVGIVLGVMALARVRRTGQAGRGMASAALVISGLWLVLIIAIIGALVSRHTG